MDIKHEEGKFLDGQNKFLWKITSVAHRNGIEKDDEKSIRRANSLFDGFDIIKERMFLRYYCDENGEQKAGYLVSSTVDHISFGKNKIVVYTLNSIYTIIPIAYVNKVVVNVTNGGIDHNLDI